MYTYCFLAENDNRGPVDVDDDGADAPHDAAHIDDRLYHATYRQTGTKDTQRLMCCDAKLSFRLRFTHPHYCAFDVESKPVPPSAERLPPRDGEQREEVHAVPHPARGQDHARPQDVLETNGGLEGEGRRRGADRHRDVARGTPQHEVGEGAKLTPRDIKYVGKAAEGPPSGKTFLKF